MTVARSILLFILAALAEIGGDSPVRRSRRQEADPSLVPPITSTPSTRIDGDG